MLDFGEGVDDIEAGPSEPNQKPIKFKKIIKVMTENLQLMDHYIQLVLQADLNHAKKE